MAVTDAPEAAGDAIVTAAGDAIVTVDHAGTIASWNPAAERLVGHPMADAVGQTFGLLTDDEGAATGAVAVLRPAGEPISFVEAGEQ